MIDGNSRSLFSQDLSLSKTYSLTNQNYDTEDLDEKIRDLQTQISNTEDLIQSTQRLKDERKQRYVKQIQELEKELSEAKDFANQEILKQKKEHTKGIQALKEQLSNEIKKIISDFNQNSPPDQIIEQNQRDLSIIGEKNSITEIEMELEVEQAKLIQSKLIAKNAKIQKQLTKSKENYNSERKMHQLEDEILMIQSEHRNWIREIRSNIKGLIDSINTREHNHNVLVEQMKKEIVNREKSNQIHINSINQIVSKEKEQETNEAEFFNKKMESLQAIYQSISQKGNIQLQMIMKDIERLKKMLEESKKSEAQSQENVKKQIIKTQQLRKEIEKQRNSITSMELEISRISEENKSSMEMQKRNTTNYSSLRSLSILY
ncbi:hypothetical protein GPJ56_010905 [Histomonas meleagridis]|uniref:uncharacterized protein n=1 Tax=Histomonas meleagridis TaxID=135588 RepID=UPI0035597AFC|nr:hypothetical protein GPJ56_010905 [Histomonas meleagridis]KAH0806294.1 hypothetical protein GO595_000982 [Histomonas meleagridis]